ncbi:MAG: hypothetical protein KGI08_08100 [Thaumarchaeota archaeon]|nr:hypothetical protein [Nitrososphaerota archaeon]
MANPTTYNFPGVSAFGGVHNFSNLAAAATTTVKTGSGLLHTINVTTAGAAASTITVYDNTAGSGTVIATLDGTVVHSYVFDVEFLTGLTVVIAGSTAPKVTFSYL